MVWCFLPFAVSLGTWLGGAWFPGGPRPVFRCCLCCHDPDLAFLILHQDVSHVCRAQWASPQFENHVQIFTSHLPMMNLQDQVTLTNWPASKKKQSCGCLCEESWQAWQGVFPSCNVMCHVLFHVCCGRQTLKEQEREIMEDME